MPVKAKTATAVLSGSASAARMRLTSSRDGPPRGCKLRLVQLDVGQRVLWQKADGSWPIGLACHNDTLGVQRFDMATQVAPLRPKTVEVSDGDLMESRDPLIPQVGHEVVENTLVL